MAADRHRPRLQHCEYWPRQQQQQETAGRDDRGPLPMTLEPMKIFSSTYRLQSPRPSVRDLARDNRGNAAIEFAMIVPLMLVMFFGTIELSSAVAVDRK